MKIRRWFASATTLLITLFLGVTLAKAQDQDNRDHHDQDNRDADAQEAVPNPTVTGPITCSTPGITCSSQLINLLGQPLTPGLPEGSVTIQPYWASSGYQEQEYFISGNAVEYQNELVDTSGNPLPLASNGLWQLKAQAGTAPYETRILVLTPMNPKKFNGTMIVEWVNVSLGFDVTADYGFWADLTQTRDYILDQGYAYVLVSAQVVGILGDQAFDTRYASLSHPGDDYSFDIFSQATQALRHPQGINPLAGLRVKKVIAVGQSQSAEALVEYINGIQPLTRLFDGFLVDDHFCCSLGVLAPNAYPAFIRTDLGIPILNYTSETDVAGDFAILGGLDIDGYISRQPDTKMFKTWEVPGASHFTLAAFLNLGQTPLTNIPPALFGYTNPENDGIVANYVHNAALQDLNIWVNTEFMVAQPAPLLSVSPPNPSGTYPSLPVLNVVQYQNQIATDGLPFGIAIGGIRTPFVDVPTSIESGKNNGPLDGLAVLAGNTTPFSAEELQYLYPTHCDYVTKVAVSTIKQVSNGFITPSDAAAIIHAAKASTIGGTGSCLGEHEDDGDK